MPDALTIGTQYSVFSFDPAQPAVCEVDSGETIVFETSDEAYERLGEGEPEAAFWKRLNPVTGPVAVRGALPGDALRVDVLSIDVLRAWVVWIPGLGGLGDKTSELQVSQAPIEAGSIRIGDRVRVPLDPMIGCVGVAPKKGVGSTVAPVGKWGGNMDLRELRAGTSISLPVFHPGGLLSLGDVHAAMGAGEPCCIAIEASARVTVRVSVEKGRKLEYPRLRIPGATVCVGLGQKIPQAQVVAIDQAYEVLTTQFGMEPFEAYAFASARLELRFGGPASPIALAVIPDPW